MHTVNFFKSPYTLATCALLFLLTAVGCNKEKTPVKKRYYFTRITPTDPNRNLMGAPDTTDWKTGDVWNEAEEKLFADSYATNCTPPHPYTITVSPNQCVNSFMAWFNKDSSTQVNMRLVDENLNVLLSVDSVTARAVAIDVSSFVKNTVRLYYKFIANNCEFKGYGDILIQ
jgi:hypothetical protein